MKQPRAHFLHIRKTAGSAIKAALQPVATSGRYHLILHDHATALDAVPANERFFFAVRDPLERFVSGFYSRQRQGLPRYHFPWSPDEEVAFGLFETASQLGEALTAPDAVRRTAAERAMRTIRHVSHSYWDWFISPDYFEQRRSDLLFIAFQDRLDRDWPALTSLLGVDDHATLPTDDVAAHRAPASVDRRLSPSAVTNLKAWYAADYDFMTIAREAAPVVTTDPGAGRAPR